MHSPPREGWILQRPKLSHPAKSLKILERPYLAHGTFYVASSGRLIGIWLWLVEFQRMTTHPGLTRHQKIAPVRSSTDGERGEAGGR